MGAVTAAVVGGVAAVGGAAMSANAAKKGAKSAQASQAAALAQYNDISTPNVSEQELDLALPELVGQYNPEMNTIETLQESSQVQDPAIKELQMKALQDMAQISEGGLRDEDIAAFREMRRKNLARYAKTWYTRFWNGACC
jgi:gas vesicle protein